MSTAAGPAQAADRRQRLDAAGRQSEDDDGSDEQRPAHRRGRTSSRASAANGGTDAAAAERTNGDLDGAPAVPTASTIPKPAAAPSAFQYVSGQASRDSVSAPKEGKRREASPASAGRDRDQQSAVDQARQPRATHPEERQRARGGVERAQSCCLVAERGIVGVGRGDQLPGGETRADRRGRRTARSSTTLAIAMAAVGAATSRTSAASAECRSGSSRRTGRRARPQPQAEERLQRLGRPRRRPASSTSASPDDPDSGRSEGVRRARLRSARRERSRCAADSRTCVRRERP